MTGIITDKFRLFNAAQFVESISEPDPSNLYIFIAKATEWDDDTTPPAPSNSFRSQEYDAWTDMIALKKINSSDVSYVIPRHNWTANSVYVEYKDTQNNITDTSFYVLTNELNVYKCLFNNAGVRSTVKPTGTSQYSITTSDGYVWKYMYTITPARALKFLTSSWMPVQTLTSNTGTPQWGIQQAAANGSIEIVDVLTGGTNYQTTSGTLTFANSTYVRLETSASSVDNFYNQSSIYISGGAGVGQLRDIIDYVGSNRQVRIGSSFTTTPNTTSSYIVSPKVSFVGDGEDAKAYSVVANNQIANVVMIDFGTNYSFANVTFVANSGSGATANAYVSPLGGHGSDAVSELGGFNLMIDVRFTGTESNTISILNDFRKVGMIQDPLRANGAEANAAIYDQTTVLTIVNSPVDTFTVDEEITGQTSGATGFVLEQISNTQIRIAETLGTFVNSETVIGAISSATANISSINSSDLLKFSGKVLYLENKKPIVRSADQSEVVKIILQY